MNRALNFVRLDFMTVKPYLTLKNLLIFSAMPLILIISSGSGMTAIGVLMGFALLYVSYPFAVGEQNGIDALYPTLSIERGTVVLGRYLFALTFDVVAGILAYIYSFVALTALQKDFDALGTLVVVLVLLVVFSVIQAIQLPIYFKLGYAKAKMLAYLPFMAFPLAVLAVNALPGDRLIHLTVFVEWIAVNPLTAAALGAVIWLGIMILSHRTSLKFYRQRDF